MKTEDIFDELGQHWLSAFLCGDEEGVLSVPCSVCMKMVYGALCCCKTERSISFGRSLTRTAVEK